ncbi:MAG: transglycosylase domain-containing protein [Candidatus Gracilibacteria bacterium]|nr:transglycosylase domain-containing protein [Candidatus Gracilibacteria bacterium]
MNDFKKEKLKITALKKAYLEAKTLKKSGGKYIVAYTGLLIFFVGILTFVIIAIYYLHDIPAISKIESDILPESTIIYDRNGGELYNLYSKEKRTYVPYDQISGHMRDAIISTEDKTFFENQGVDFRGLVRSGLNYITGKTDKIQGTSTISQQLIINVFLSAERSMDRKIKEIYLSYRLNSKYSKEKILELYLNKISFGNNAFGIEEAAKTYFNKSSKDVGILGSSILASLPKGPSYYSPYSHRDRLMGYLYVYDQDMPGNTIQIDTVEKFTEYSKLVEDFKAYIAGLKFKPTSGDKLTVCNVTDGAMKKKMSIDSDGCVTLSYGDLLSFLNNIKVEYTEEGENPKTLVLEYNTGRKDFVLGRMFEDEKIKGEEYQGAFIGGLEFQFQKYRENIKYPHFVFYVKDYLENKFGKDFEAQGGLKIYTTIDPVLQDKAEELVEKQVKINATKYGAKSAALVSMDNKTGQILAMVGGADYFNGDEDGNVNIITSKRQPGSSFKPIVYTLAISKNPIGPDTPIFDVKTKFGDWEPNNYDEKFLGKMPLKKALDYSRNIPAIKMFYVAGGEASIVEFAESLGITSLNRDGQYGAPLAIGTGELKPIELLQAYSVFANGGYRKDVTPIMRIEDKKGNIVDQYSESAGKYVVSDAAAYIISTILSDAKSRPGDFWNNVLTLKDRPVAAKTGTSNKDVTKEGKKKQILPRDLWTAGYTPQITTVVWAGNVDGSETKGTCDGLNCAAPIWHSFMEAAHKNLKKEEFKKPASIISATISETSGRLASESTPNNLRVTSIFAVKPTEYEGASKMIEVDSLCNGKVTDSTPKDAIKKGYLIENINPIIDSYDKDWLIPIYGWTKSEAGKSYFSGTDNTDNIFTTYSEEICVRPNVSLSSITISSSFKDGGTYPLGKFPFEIQYTSDNAIARFDIFRDDTLLKSIKIDEQTTGTYKVPAMQFDESFAGNHTITVRAIDKYGYAGSSSAAVTFEERTGGPEITIVSPLKESALTRIYPDQYFNLRFSVAPGGNEVTGINIFVDGKLLKILGGGTDFTVAINEEKNLSIGEHTVQIEAIDAKLNKSKKTVPFEIIEN